jgi:hypothetical chaperone protein
MSRAVGIDFGTTNSAIAIADDGAAPRLAQFPSASGETSTFRSILYFERDGSGRRPQATAGPRAIEGYLEPQDDGRLVQSLKSFLASRLFSSTSVLGSTFRLEALIALILEALREAAEEQFGALGGRVVAGRPVRFANAESDEDEELALSRLRAAFHNAGFGDVVFEYEPVAAAYTYEAQLDRDELIVIADFGGGTSDFSLLRVGPGVRASKARAEALLATAGVPIAGDCFDGQIVRHVVAPHLGMGTEYQSLFGRTLRVPEWIYVHLQRWNHLSFLKTPKTMQILHDLRRESVEPKRFDALIHIVRADLGFHLYRSVQDSKLELSRELESRFEFSDDPVSIAQNIQRDAFESWIADELGEIEACLDQLLERAAVSVEVVDRVFLTGGSSLLPVVRGLFAERFGAHKIRSGNELTSVATGLALRARELP